MNASLTMIEFQCVSELFRRHADQVLLRKRLVLSHRERLCAFKDVSCAVERGDSLAVVGRNGAEKSTVLGLVARVAMPGAGIIQVNGRIAPLLELGTGFHPDLNDKKNLPLNAALLGLTRKDAELHYGSIVDFPGSANSSTSRSGPNPPTSSCAWRFP